MSYEDELRLMELLIKLGFDRVYLIWVLHFVECGQMIGEAMSNAIGETAKNRLPKDEQ